jgi:hypothetical protein
VDWFKESVERDILRERLNRLMMGYGFGEGDRLLRERFELDISGLFNSGNLRKIVQNGALRGTEKADESDFEICESASGRKNEVTGNAFANDQNGLNWGQNNGAIPISSNADTNGFGIGIGFGIGNGFGFFAQSTAFAQLGDNSLSSNEYNPNRAINPNGSNQPPNHYPNTNHNYSDKTDFPTYPFFRRSNSEDGLTDCSGNEVSVNSADVGNIAEGVTIPQGYSLGSEPVFALAPVPKPTVLAGGIGRLSGNKELAAAVIRLIKSDTERIANGNSYSSNGLTESNANGLDFGLVNANGNGVGNANANAFATGRYGNTNGKTKTNATAINTNSIVNQSVNNSLGSIIEENTYTESSLKSDFGAEEAVEAVIEYLVRELNGGV